MPPVVRARDGSARQNRSKTRAVWSARSPMPWSRTRTATASASRGDVHLDRPALAVLERVDDEVAQHPLDPHVVQLGDDGRAGRPETCTSLPRRSARAAVCSSTRSTSRSTSVGSTSRSAAPAS